MEYKFRKEVAHERLVTLLKLSSFSDKIGGIKIDGLDITISTNIELSLLEKTELESIMLNYSDFDLSAMRKDALEKSARFGQDLIRDFGLRDIGKGYTEPQKFQVLLDIQHGFILLTTGSLETFLYWADNVFVPTELVTIDDVEFFKMKVMDFLNTL